MIMGLTMLLAGWNVGNKDWTFIIFGAWIGVGFGFGLVDSIRKHWISRQTRTDTQMLVSDDGIRLVEDRQCLAARRWNELPHMTFKRHWNRRWRLQAYSSAWRRFFMSDIDVDFDMPLRHAAIIRREIRRRIKMGIEQK